MAKILSDCRDLAVHRLMLAFSANYGPIATFLAELFGSKIRYSGLSVAYMLSGLLGSALTPAVTVALFEATGRISSIGWYVAGAAVLSLGILDALTKSQKRFSAAAVDWNPDEVFQRGSKRAAP